MAAGFALHVRIGSADGRRRKSCAESAGRTGSRKNSTAANWPSRKVDAQFAEPSRLVAREACYTLTTATKRGISVAFSATCATGGLDCLETLRNASREPWSTCEASSPQGRSPAPLALALSAWSRWIWRLRLRRLGCRGPEGERATACGRAPGDRRCGHLHRH